MNTITKVFDFTQKEKLACITLDFEMDYGWRTRQFNILQQNRVEVDALGDFFRELNIPVSMFIVTHLLDDFPETMAVLKNLGADFHCHSHTHNMDNFDSTYEIETMTATFEKHFGYAPTGYRAPLGVLRPGEVDLLHEHGLKFSSSVFPGYRPGHFNNMTLPYTPFLYENGIMEMPFSVVKKLRTIISLSYLKLLGFQINRALFAAFGLPPVIIFDSHLHDFIINPFSFGQLPLKYRLAWGRNRYKGRDYLKAFVELLRKKDYRFITVSELYHRLEMLETGESPS